MRGTHLALIGTGLMLIGVSGAILAVSDPHPHGGAWHRPDAEGAPSPISTPTLRPLIPLVPVDEPRHAPRRAPRVRTTPYVLPTAATVAPSRQRSLAVDAVAVTGRRARPMAPEHTSHTTHGSHTSHTTHGSHGSHGVTAPQRSARRLPQHRTCHEEKPETYARHMSRRSQDDDMRPVARPDARSGETRPQRAGGHRRRH